MDFKENNKGLIIESAVLLGNISFNIFLNLFKSYTLDPNKENRKDIELMLEAQGGQGVFGKYEFGKYSFYVEEMKAAPTRNDIEKIVLKYFFFTSRYCPYLNSDRWASDKVLNSRERFMTISLPLSGILFVGLLSPMILLGYDGLIFRKLFGI